MIDGDQCKEIGGIPDGLGACRIANDFLDFVLGDKSCEKLNGTLIAMNSINVCSVTTSPSKKYYSMLNEAKTALYDADYSGIFAFGNFYRFAAKFKEYRNARKLDKKFGTHICTDEGVTGNLFEETIQSHIEDSHLFEIANGVRLLLSKTKPPNINDIFKLPFKTIFLDVDFKRDEMLKFGVDIGYKEIIGLMVTDGKMIMEHNPDGCVVCRTTGEYDDAKEVGRALRMTFIGVNDDGSTQFDVFNGNINVKNEYADWKIKKAIPGMCNRDARRFIHTFTINFLNFIYSPEVAYVEKQADVEKNKKRIHEGKAPVPPRNFITLTGQVKKYAQDINDNPEKWQYSHRFYVMGHWRTLQAPRYGKNIGKRIWVDDFIKGDGVLIEKKYVLDSESGTELD